MWGLKERDGYRIGVAFRCWRVWELVDRRLGLAAGQRTRGKVSSRVVNPRVRQTQRLHAGHTFAPRESKRLQDIGRNADGDPFGGTLDRVAREMCVARGGLDAAVTEQAADDWQALAERERPRGEAVRGT